MKHEPKRPHDAPPGQGHHHHRGKSSEPHLDKGRILRALELRDGQTVLDAGCGNGYMARVFAEQVGPAGRVIALDPDEEAIAALREKTLGGNLETVVADITKPTPLEAASLDVLYVSTVLHGFSGPAWGGFLAEARRLLRPAGVLAVVEFDRKETPFGPPIHIRLSPEDLKQRVPLTPGPTVPVGGPFYLQLFTQPVPRQEV